MSNTLYLDETLTGLEREFVIESTKLDISMDKLNVLYEAVCSTLNANYREAELKVYSENGTYEDLAMLYTEAEKEAAGKQRSILGSVFKIIKDLCTTIKNFIVNIFTKKVQSVTSDELEVNEEEYNTLKSTQSFGDMVKGGLANVAKSSKATLEKLRDNIKKHKILTAVAGIGAAAAGAAAGAAIHHTKKVKKSEVLALTNQATKTMTIIDDATGNVETIITVTNFTATAASAATANSSSDAGKAVNDTKILAKIRDAIKNLFAKRDAVSGTVIDPNKKPDTSEKNPKLGAGKDNGSPAGPAGQNNSIPAGKNNGSPAGPAGQNNSIPAGKNNGLPEPKLQLSEADIEKLVHNFSAKLRTTKQRGEKINKFASLLRNST